MGCQQSFNEMKNTMNFLLATKKYNFVLFVVGVCFRKILYCLTVRLQRLIYHFQTPYMTRSTEIDEALGNQPDSAQQEHPDQIVTPYPGDQHP